MSQSAAPAEIRFVPEFDQPVRYMLRTRRYYLGLGYKNPYIWAHYIEAPFTPLKKPLSSSRLAPDQHAVALSLERRSELEVGLLQH